MVTIACPWCDDEQGPQQLISEDHDDTPFRCLECGTTVLWADGPDAVLDLAA